MSIDNVMREFNSLPSELQQEASDFIAFLHRRQKKQKAIKPKKTLKLTSEPFIGMWEDRHDMKDSSGWVKDMRQKEWGAK